MDGIQQQLLRMRPIIKWHSYSKKYIQWIHEHLPPHETFLEPFGGACQVLMGKPPCGIEIFNDLDGDVIAFWKTVQSSWHSFQRKLTLVPYSHRAFERWCLTEASSSVDRAVAFYVSLRQSMTRAYERRPRADWFLETRVNKRGMAEHVSDWLRDIDRDLPVVIERLRTVQFTQMDAIDFLESLGERNSLVFVDPPFYDNCQEDLRRDGFEMSQGAQVRMLDRLIVMKSNVAILGRHCDMYDQKLGRWYCWELGEEVLWLKRKC